MKESIQTILHRAKDTTPVPNYLLWGAGLSFIYLSVYRLGCAIGSLSPQQRMPGQTDPATVIVSLCATAALFFALLRTARAERARTREEEPSREA